MPLSGMMLTGEIMQIYADGNRSFEGCQLDLGTPAMKASNENLLCWQARVHTDNARTQTSTHTGTCRLPIHNLPESA